MPSQHPPSPLDHAEQAASGRSVKATAIYGTMSALAGQQHWAYGDHAVGCWRTPGLTGDARAQWLDTFCSEASILREILTHVIWTGDKTSQEALETALAVLQSRLGCFPEIEPTVKAVASWVLTHGALAWIPREVPITRSVKPEYLQTCQWGLPLGSRPALLESATRRQLLRLLALCQGTSQALTARLLELSPGLPRWLYLLSHETLVRISCRPGASEKNVSNHSAHESPFSASRSQYNPAYAQQ